MSNSRNPIHFEFDLSKIKTLLGFTPQHDLASILDAAEAMRRGEDVGIIPTGVRWKLTVAFRCFSLTRCQK